MRSNQNRVPKGHPSGKGGQWKESVGQRAKFAAIPHVDLSSYSHNEPNTVDRPLINVDFASAEPVGGLPEGVVWNARNKKLSFFSDVSVDLHVGGDAGRDGPTVLYRDGPGDGHLIFRGKGHVILVRDGDGTGDAIAEEATIATVIREGNGDGSAVSRCRNGNTSRTGSGAGNSCNHNMTTGDAKHSGSGPGDAIRDQGRGDAIRTGNIAGDAVREGVGNGSALCSTTSKGQAIRSGKGDGDAIRENGPDRPIHKSSGKGSALTY